MVEKIEAFKAHDGKLFLTEESATRYEAVEGLCRIIPEFALVRNRLESSLDAVATAMGPMLRFRERVPSKGPIDEDGAALLAGNDGRHHPTCASLAPGR